MNTLPKVAAVEQQFSRPRVDDIAEAVQQTFSMSASLLQSYAGKSIGITAGSRGITQYTQLMKAAVDALKRYDIKPFIFPAMGSHGGGTADGQRKVLAEYDITEDSMGVPIKSSLETVIVGETEQGFPVHFDPYAFEADGVLVLNRVKPHTDFTGTVESGIQKMMTVGVGKIKGAQTLHNNSSNYTFDTMIQSIAAKVLGTGKIMGGLAILENAYHEIAEVEFIQANNIQMKEPQILERARSYMPSLPIEQADVLVLDYIGKDISGVGMDPNIVGRHYRINSHWQEKPDITRIVVMNLTEKTNGNASGIGLADFCSQRAVDQMDKHSTYLNSITSRNTVCANIPLHFDRDIDVLHHTIRSLGNFTSENVRLLHIRDTLNLTHIEASKALLQELRNHPNVQSVSDLHDIQFNEHQQIKPLEIDYAQQEKT